MQYHASSDIKQYRPYSQLYNTMLICGVGPPGTLCSKKLDIGPLVLEPAPLKGMTSKLFLKHPEAFLFPNSNPIQSSSGVHSLPQVVVIAEVTKLLIHHTSSNLTTCSACFNVKRICASVNLIFYDNCFWLKGKTITRFVHFKIICFF